MIYKQENLNKPYTRMWIYGCSATKEEIDMNIQYLKQANIGGVELQMIYPLSKNDNLEFFSPEFFEMMNYFVDKLYENKIDIDLTLGSGWPFGAPFITKDMSPDILIPYQQDIKGPVNYSFDFTNILSGKIIKAVLGKVEDAVVIEDTLIDVTDKVEKTFISVWPWGENISNLEVKEGCWRLFLFISNEYRQQVGKAAPNMEGYVMDHCRSDVTNAYIENFANVYLDNLDTSKIRSVFCDSIELTASNWTKYLLDEFKKDHGYDLSKYMPALWMDIGDKTPYIRHDYYETYGRLTIDNFFQLFKDWSDKKGVEFRLQAHGTWADIIDAYGASHIPEGETFGFGDTNSVNINHRRLAVSSGLIYDKEIVSNESYTWLRKPRFLVTLEIMKRASDAIFCDGINHIINHGYSFYKGERYENIFYASSLISPHNSWFKHYKHLSKYLENCMNILQNSKIVSKTAIFTPVSHIWSTNIMAELHMSLQIEKHFTQSMADKIHQCGFWFSFVNDYAILNNKLENVERIVVPKVKYIKTNTLEKLYELSKSIKIIFTDEYPCSCAGLNEFNNVEEFYTILHKIKESSSCVVVNHDDLDLYLSSNFEKDFICNNKNISFINKVDQSNHKITFVSNISDQKQRAEIYIKDNFKIYDPIKDELTKVHKYENNLLEINFKPNESFFILESDKEYVSELFNFEFDKSELSNCELVINDNVVKLDRPITWECIDEFKSYSGDASYIFNFEKSSNTARLVIPNLYGVAAVILNGEKQDTIWYNNECVIRNLKSENKLEIVITSNIFNEAKSRNDNVENELLSDKWPYFNQIIENHRYDKMYTWRDKEEFSGYLKSGIEGAVEIRWLK